VVGPTYQEPSTITPDTWNQKLAQNLNSGSSSLSGWWTRFNDPALNNLIKAARTSNRDLAIAYERITQARAARGIARSGLFPSLELNGGVARSRTSEAIGLPPSSGGQTSDLWVTGLDAGWEADFFGGVRRAIESADATTAGLEEAYRDTLVTLLAEVALNYVQIRTFEERIRLAEGNVVNQQESVTLTSARLDAGLAPETDVTQANSNLATTRAAIPSLRSQRAVALNRLATLIGRYPAAAESFLKSGKGIPMPSRNAGVGIPADLVRARPDIRAAERNLAAQVAQIGVAEADLYPRFSLSGTFQLQSSAPENLLEMNSRNYSFGPSFRWNLFSGGRIRSQIEIESSLARQAFQSYEGTVLRAVEEVENALAAVYHERDRLGALDDAVKASKKTVSLVKDNYREGLIDFQNVLDAERTIFTNEDTQAVSKGQIAAAYIALYKSLGGGAVMSPAK